MSASRPVATERALEEFRLRGGHNADNPDGWGLAYWEHGAFHVFKEPETAAKSAKFLELCKTVRSNLIVAHVRKANHPPVATMTNTHPFKQICCGSEWVFAHNGLVPEIVELELAMENPFCRPTGETDSEHAFCHLLGHIAQQFHGAQLTDTAVWFQALAAVSELVASYGKFNFLMSNGEHLIAFGHDRLHYLEEDVAAEVAEAGEAPAPIRRVLIATEPLTAGGDWSVFEPGELRIYRLGRLVGKTQPHLQLNPA